MYITDLQDNTYLMVSKKVLADDIVNIRAARGPDEKKGEKHPPLIVSIPRSIADAAKVQKGDKMRIYTDGEKVYLDKVEKPTIS
jgi:hypothetical protein